ncbi:hypothetical protein OF83DRAFT_1064423 [Amylostereum chailletii]|nr:hypothetical protein OF83DRAFT_1064423 [Amylostereum chailletii]
MSTKPFVLYDLPGNFTSDQAWSPNVWKIRYILNLKRLPYTTEWVEFPDIASVAQRIGAPPTAHRRDGTPLYTLPILHDPASNQHLSNSTDIARFLDRRFPDPASAPAPALFPAGTDALLAAFQRAWVDGPVKALVPLMLLRVHDGLPPRSAAFFRATREAMFKARLEAVAPAAAQAALWANARAALGVFDAYLRENGHSEDAGPFVMGHARSYADVQIAGWLVWVKRVWGPASAEWRALAGWHGGRWGRLMAEFDGLEYTERDAPPPAAKYASASFRSSGRRDSRPGVVDCDRRFVRCRLTPPPSVCKYIHVCGACLPKSIAPSHRRWATEGRAHEPA